MLWAYFNFSQWLIIWAGNLPGGNYLVLPSVARRMGLRGPFSRSIPLRCSVRHFARPPVQTQKRALWFGSPHGSCSCASSTSGGMLTRCFTQASAFTRAFSGRSSARSQSVDSGWPTSSATWRTSRYFPLMAPETAKLWNRNMSNDNLDNGHNPK